MIYSFRYLLGIWDLSPTLPEYKWQTFRKGWKRYSRAPTHLRTLKVSNCWIARGVELGLPKFQEKVWDRNILEVLRGRSLTFEGRPGSVLRVLIMNNLSAHGGLCSPS